MKSTILVLLVLVIVSSASSDTVFKVKGVLSCEVPLTWCVDIRMWSRNLMNMRHELLDAGRFCLNEKFADYRLAGTRKIELKHNTYEIILAVSHNCTFTPGEELRLTKSMSSDSKTVTDLDWDQDLTDEGITPEEDKEAYTHTINGLIAKRKVSKPNSQSI